MMTLNRRRSSATTLARRTRRHRRPLVLEGLEPRIALSTFTVNSTLDDGSAGTLRYEIGLANAEGGGSTVNFDPVVFATHQTITLAPSLSTLDLSETGGTEIIQGPTVGVTIAGDNTFRILHVTAADVTASLSDLTISAGSTTGDGGGLYNEGTVSLTRCTITGNSADGSGGGVGSTGAGAVALDACTFSDNSASYNGGGLGVSGSDSVTLTGCTFSGNSTGQHGGGVAWENSGTGTLTISGGSLTGNTASSNGGGIASNNSGTGAVAITGVTLSTNSAYEGGGIYSENSSTGTMTMTDCSLTGNSADHYGGGLYSDNSGGGAVTITGGSLASNSASSGGGGIYSDNSGAGTVAITGGSFTSNSASYYGGGIYSENSGTGTVAMTDCSLSGNSTDEYGGGIYNYNTGGGTVTITGGSLTGNSAASDGGGISNYNDGGGTVEINGVSLTGNTANYGGGIYSDNYVGTTTIDACTLTRNSADQDGGGIYSYQSGAGEVRINGGTFSNNSVRHDEGGGIYNYNSGGTVTITDCSFTTNSAYYYGGGIYNYNSGSGSVTITGCTFTTNSAFDDYGGGIYNENNGDGTVEITGGTFIGNFAYSGGGIYNQNYGSFGASTVTIGDCVFSGNSALDYGGGIYNEEYYDGAVEITGCTLNGNTALYDGGGIYNEVYYGGTVTISGCTLTGNIAPSDEGGGIYNYSRNYSSSGVSTVTITGCTLTGNSAYWYGGGIYSDNYNVSSGASTVTIESCSLTGNSAGYGGGIYSENYGYSGVGTTTIRGCTLADNSAGFDGGGLYNYDGDPVSTATIENCSIAENSAGQYGGGIYNYNYNGSTVALTYCTIARNSAGSDGGGLYNDNSDIPLTLTDTIVAANTGGASGSPNDIQGGSASDVTGSNNLIGTGGSGGISDGVDGNIVLTDLAELGLAPLGDYGGTTQTLALVPGSRAIGNGSGVSGITADQRGAPRAETGAVDIGAFQDQGYTLAYVSGSGQLAETNQAFANPLVARLTEDFVDSPIPGAMVTFEAPLIGPSATVSPNPVQTGAEGLASVTATANALPGGPYDVTATAAAPTVGLVTFALSNDKATPTITWANPADIVYGMALSDTQLNATASVQGTFAYTPAAGTVLNAGAHQALVVDFTPDDPVHYNDATATVYINVLKATPTITWVNPADIAYGTALSGTQLNATASVSGGFTYNPPAGTVLNVGAHQALEGSFAPTDSTNYNDASATVYINVIKATPTITWANPADIVYGTALSGTQLNATASVPGMFVYVPSDGAVLNAGAHQALQVFFVPNDSVSYNNAAGTAFINVSKAATTVTWANPADIGYGTALSSTQLNATASVPGFFAYNPPTGTVLGGGAHQALQVTFTPADAVNYQGSSATAYINVTQGSTVTTFITGGGSSIYGQAASFAVQVAPTSPSGVMPTGSVRFLVDGSPTDVALDALGHATLTTTALDVGSHSVTASYLGNTTYLASPSAGPVSWQVLQANTSNSLTISINGRKVILTSQVGAVAPGAGTPSGALSFYRANGRLMGTVNLSGGAGSLTLKRSYAVGKKFWAKYNGSVPYAVSESARIQVASTTMARAATRAFAPLSTRISGMAEAAANKLSAVAMGVLPSFDHKKGR